MTRVSSFHQYKSVSNDLMKQQVKLQKNHDQLASGKRVLTAGDDPISSIHIQNFKQNNAQIEKYLESINLAKNRQNRAELSISQSETLIDSTKIGVMKMLNGSLSSEDRQAYKHEIQAAFNDFMGLVNAKDESGNFLFSGTQSSKQPFFRDGSGNVSYVGDSFHRSAKVSASVLVQTSDPGDKLFMNVPNPFGDYQPEYALENKSSLLLSQATNTNDADNAAYEVSFAVDDNGQTTYSLKQDNTEVATGVYDPESGIEWGTLKLTFEGEMVDGDSMSFERQDSFSIFDVFQKTMALADEKGSDPSATAELHQAVREFSQAFNHMNQVRSEIGTRLNTLDRQEEMHLDYQVVLNNSLGTMEDLDYASAIIDMNENMVALEASQKAFTKTKELSLFNYI